MSQEKVNALSVGTHGSCVRGKMATIYHVKDIYADARAVRPYSVITLAF